MGTTVVAARITGNRFEVAWVGDSRVYLWHEQKLAQLSQDHSYVQELISQGTISVDQARTHPHRNVVTQALGVTDPPKDRKSGGEGKRVSVRLEIGGRRII